MNKFIVEVRIGYGTVLIQEVGAITKGEALEKVKQKLSDAGLNKLLPKYIEAFSKIVEVK